MIDQEKPKNPPRVSVVIPVWNRPQWIVETLESLKAQTYPHWEAVVVDDQSSDATFQVVRHLAATEPRVCPRRRVGAVRGAPACRNQGCAASQGEYVIFLDSDDLLTPDCLEHRVAWMSEHPELDFCVSGTRLFRQRLGDLDRCMNRDTGEDDLDRFLAGDLPWCTPAPTWRRAALERLGPWDEGLKVGQDLDFSMRALVHGLNYQRTGRLDVEVRVGPKDHSVGLIGWSAEGLPSQMKRLDTLHKLLIESGKLTPKRRRYLAGNYFWMARQWRRCGSGAAARLAWREARIRRLIGRVTWLQGWLCLAAWPAWLGRVMLYTLRGCWPRELFVHNSATLFNTPIHAVHCSGTLRHDRAPWGVIGQNSAPTPHPDATRSRPKGGGRPLFARWCRSDSCGQ